MTIDSFPALVTACCVGVALVARSPLRGWLLTVCVAAAGAAIGLMADVLHIHLLTGGSVPIPTNELIASNVTNAVLVALLITFGAGLRKRSKGSDKSSISP